MAPPDFTAWVDTAAIAVEGVTFSPAGLLQASSHLEGHALCFEGSKTLILS
jgi:hypothetical protein